MTWQGIQEDLPQGACQDIDGWMDGNTPMFFLLGAVIVIVGMKDEDKVCVHTCVGIKTFVKLSLVLGREVDFDFFIYLFIITIIIVYSSD